VGKSLIYAALASMRVYRCPKSFPGLSIFREKRPVCRRALECRDRCSVEKNIILPCPSMPNPYCPLAALF
jgi:hypothetical protein